jgi:hypothetical protein
VKRLALPIFVLAAAAVFIVGCGSSSGSSNTGGSSGNGVPNGGGGVNGISVGNCLNDDEDFLVQPSQTVLDGQSPAGVSFTLTFYKDTGAAQSAAAKKNKKFTSVVENGVIDFKGNPSANAGAAPAKISKVELNAIKRCIDKTKGK